jgi:hypothetical protein
VRRAVPALILLTLFLAADAPAAPPPPYGFAFGRLGGNIRPYTVRIANTGVVKVEGPARVGRKLLAPAVIGGLNLKAVEVAFARLPKARSCARALPDVAYTFIRVGAQTVRVRGTCVPQYTRLWNALAHAVRLDLS